LLLGPEVAQPQLEALMAEASGPHDDGDQVTHPAGAIDAALMLGDLDRARAILRSAPTSFASSATPSYEALIDLVGDARRRRDLDDAVAGVVRGTVRPYALKELARVTCPVLEGVYPAAAPALRAVAAAAEARLSEATPMLLANEFEARSPTGDDVTLELVGGLLGITDLVDAGDAVNAAQLTETLIERCGRPFGPELRRLGGALASRPVDA
jgi:hypothetical protein